MKINVNTTPQEPYEHPEFVGGHIYQPSEHGRLLSSLYIGTWNRELINLRTGASWSVLPGQPFGSGSAYQWHDVTDEYEVVPVGDES